MKALCTSIASLGASARVTGLLVALAAVASCGPGGGAGSSNSAPVPLSTLTPTQLEQAQRAGEARDSMFQSLIAELSDVLEKGGPGEAIAVCRERAPRLAREAGQRMGLRIGRTSHRLRNPANAPPAWAAQLVAQRRESPAHFALEGGALGVLMPIPTAAPCLNCHGDVEKLPPEVREALATNYPEDKAVGFRVGELRGWFWVEVPPLR